MSGSLRRLARAYDLVVVGLAVAAAGCVLVILVLISGDVASRLLGFGSWLATIPVVEAALLYFSILSAPWLVREKGHVAVDSFIAKAPAGFRRATVKAVLAISVLCCGVVGAVALILLEEVVASGDMEIGGIDLPYWLYVAPLPLGYVLVATEFLRLLLRGETPYSDSLSEGL